MHIDLGRAPPACPQWHGLLEHIPFPSLFVLFLLAAVLGVVFSLITGCKYNSVRVFDHRIRTPNISNTLWILYFSTIAVRGVANAIRYGVRRLSDPLHNADGWFFAGTLALHGISAFFLQLALNHQRKYRSSGPISYENHLQQQSTESDSLLRRYDRIRKNVTLVDVLFFLLLVLYFVFEFLMLLNHTKTDYQYAFEAVFGLQRLPILVLVFIIVFRPAVEQGDDAVPYEPNEGPSRKAKVFLLLAAVLNVFGDIPLRLWAQIFKGGCVITVGSAVDILHFVYILAMIFFFAFLRAEYMRNMEECIWHTVQKFQDTFDFRKF